MCSKNWARTAVGLLVLSFVVGGLVSPTKQIERKTEQPGHKKQANVGLVFDPPSLDFGDCAVSVVWRQKVNIKNSRANDRPINILSISGSSLHFHCSFVENRVLDSQANTSFEVVFLSREEGFADDTLYVHTNRGSFPYKVQARGTANPFLARPFVNVRIPVNTTFSPLIHLYNPFASALQVLEMFGSSCDLHLEMPGGFEGESSIDWWLIPPHQSKAIARVNFLAVRAVNLTAFVRIRTNYTAQPHGSIVLPVNLEVTSQPLLFCPQQFLDFGVVGPDDPPRTLKLFVINSGNRPVTVQSVTGGSSNDGLTIEFSPVKVAPSLTTPTLVALVTFRPSMMAPLRTASGRLTIQSKNGHHRATIGYQITVPASYLNYNRSSVNFLAHRRIELPDCRVFSVLNEFALAVQLTHVSIESQEFIEVEDVELVVLKPKEKASVLRVCLKKLPDVHEEPFTVQLEVKTNASAPLRAPVSVFSGRLSPFWSDEYRNSTRLSIGRLSEGSSKELYLALFNRNPVGVALDRWRCNSTRAVLTYVGSEAGTVEQFSARSRFSNLTLSATVRPGSYAVFHVRIRAGSRDAGAARIDVNTEHEELDIVIRYETVPGGLHTVPDPLAWKASFLDPFLSTEVRVNSTLNESVTVIGFQAPGPHKNKLIVDLYDEKNASGRIVEAMQSTGVGRLVYPIDWQCAQSPLRQLLDRWQHHWSARNDLELISTLYGCFESVSRAWNSTSVRLVTREVGFTEISLKLDVQWPRLSPKKKLSFPLTEVGEKSRMDLKLTNPTSGVILAQVLWLEDAGIDVGDLIDKLPDELTEGLDAELVKSHAFSFDDADETDRDSMMVYLTPGSKAAVGVTFHPTTEARHKSILMIKNNVTGVELIGLSGHGQSPRFTIDNKLPGSALPFDVSEHHLKNCDARLVVPSVTVKRTFVARNRGPFPLVINGFDINGQGCEGYGFRVLQCSPTTLLPNESRSLEVAFTPDFTQTRITRLLFLRTNGKEFNFTLLATVPGHMLETCASGQPRPHWEHYVKFSLIAVVGLMMMGCVVIALLDGGHVLKRSPYYVVCLAEEEASASERPPVAVHKLDLRSVGKEVVLLSPSSPPTPPPATEPSVKKEKVKKVKQRQKQKTVQLKSPSPQPTKRPVTPPADTPPRAPSPVRSPSPAVKTTIEETRIFAKAAKGAKKASKPAKEQKSGKQDVDRKRARSPSRPGATKKENVPVVAPVATEASPPKKSNEELPNVWRVKEKTVPVGKILPEVRKAPEASALPKPIGYRESQEKGGEVRSDWSTAWWPESRSLFSQDDGLHRFGSAVAWSWPETDARVYSPWSMPHWLDVTRENQEPRWTDRRDESGTWETQKWPDTP